MAPDSVLPGQLQPVHSQGLVPVPAFGGRPQLAASVSFMSHTGTICGSKGAPKCPLIQTSALEVAGGGCGGFAGWHQDCRDPSIPLPGKTKPLQRGAGRFPNGIFSCLENGDVTKITLFPCKDNFIKVPVGRGHSASCALPALSLCAWGALQPSPSCPVGVLGELC